MDAVAIGIVEVNEAAEGTVTRRLDAKIVTSKPKAY